MNETKISEPTVTSLTKPSAYLALVKVLNGVFQIEQVDDGDPEVFLFLQRSLEQGIRIEFFKNVSASSR